MCRVQDLTGKAKSRDEAFSFFERMPPTFSNDRRLLSRRSLYSIVHADHVRSVTLRGLCSVTVWTTIHFTPMTTRGRPAALDQEIQVYILLYLCSWINNRIAKPSNSAMMSSIDLMQNTP